jgi:hypothetical protein
MSEIPHNAPSWKHPSSKIWNHVEVFPLCKRKVHIHLYLNHGGDKIENMKANAVNFIYIYIYIYISVDLPCKRIDIKSLKP